MTSSPRGIRSLCTLLAVISVVACGKPSRPNPSSPGDVWLEMSRREKRQAIGGFITGFQLSELQACELATAKWDPSSPEFFQGLSETKLAPLDLCIQKVGKFSRVRNAADDPSRFDAYADVITALYERYPGQRGISMGILMLSLKDGLDTTVEELHIDAGKSIVMEYKP